MQDKQKRSFSSIHTALLTLALVLAALYWFAHPGIFSKGYRHLPGLGLMVSQWALLSGVLIAARLQKQLHIRTVGVLLAVLSLGLSACYGLYANDDLRLMNLPVLTVLTWLAAYTLTAPDGYAPFSMNGLRNAWLCFWRSLFRHILVPFRALRIQRSERGIKWDSVLIGVMLCVPVLLIATGLLLSADPIFDTLWSRTLNSLFTTDGTVVPKLLMTFGCGLLLFSLLYGLLLRREAETSRKERIVSPAIFLATLIGLTVLYSLFGYVQIRYLFDGTHAAAMNGGYAEYARSGFFQLVAVALLTLCVVLPSLCLCAKSKSIRVLCVAVSLLTVLITVSAFFRMRLYILAYGMSLLRALTLWAQLMILIALCAAIVKGFVPAVKIGPMLCAVVLTSWVALNLCNLDLRVAQYNVRAYNRGQLTQLDTDYLAQLSPAVLPALMQIEDPILREATLTHVADHWDSCRPCLYDTAVVWRHFEKN